MAVLVFRHGPLEPIGMIADVLGPREIEWRYVDMAESQDDDLPAQVDEAQGLIVMGGAMSVNDSLPWLRQEERCLVRAISSGIPIFGVCLGAQLLAKCLGARVSPMGCKEIGWYPVRFTEDARQDPLFEGLAPEETVFQWHGDTFELPAGSVRLAESDLCANQAFRSGSNLYGVQFHPEVTPGIIDSWCVADSHCGEQREASGPIDAEAHQDRMRQMANVIFGKWCEMIVSR